MTMIVNGIDLLDANGTSYPACVENFKRGNAANVTFHTDGPVAGTPKFSIPLTDEELQSEIEKENYEEHFMPRTIKLAVLAALRATKHLELPKNTAVIGVTLQGSQDSYGQVWTALQNNKKFISPRVGATIAHSAICTTVSRKLGLTGPSFMISQACSSFIVAMNTAELMLNAGQAAAVLVIGIDCATNPLTTFIFNSMNVCTKTSVMPFDVDRSGMALGEAAVCFVLTRPEQAQHSIAEVSAISVYNDYYSMTSPTPDGTAGKFLLKELTNNNQITLDSVNCHTTATIVGDEAELLALESLPYSCPIYGLKGSVGHTMASSAGVELAYGIAGLREGWIPYTSTTTNPVATKHHIVLHNILHQEQKNFAKLSFGFGGASAGVRISKV